MVDFRDKARKASMEYRDFWAENPELGMALGFVPIVSTVLGVADAVAAQNDERASLLDKSLATAGILPMGKGIAAVKSVLAGKSGGALMSIVGPTIIKDFEKAGRAGELINRGIDPELGVETAEILGRGQLKPQTLETLAQGKHAKGQYKDLVEGDPLAEVRPDVAKLKTHFDPNMDSQTGYFQPEFAGKPPELRIGAMQPGGGPMDRATRINVDQTRGHEVRGHVAEDIEVKAGTFPKSYVGTNPNESGWTGYAARSAEHGAQAEQLRHGWDVEDLEALTPYQHRKAVEQHISDNLALGKFPDQDRGLLARPDVAKRFWDRYEQVGPNPAIKRAAARKNANWQVDMNPKKGEWSQELSVAEVAELDPAAGAKFRTMFDEGSLHTRPATNRGKGTNWGQQMQFDEKIPAVRAKVRYNESTKAWDVEEVDGLRRALVAQQQFGKKVKVPVVYEPVDDVSRIMGKDAAAQSSEILPKRDLYDKDRMDNATPYAALMQRFTPYYTVGY